MTPRHPQAAFVRDEIRKGGDMTLTAPVGMGRNLALVQALAEIPGPALFVSIRRELRDQMAVIAAREGVPLDCVSPQDAPGRLASVVILSEELGGLSLDHPWIVRLK